MTQQVEIVQALARIEHAIHQACGHPVVGLVGHADLAQAFRALREALEPVTDGAQEPLGEAQRAGKGKRSKA